MSDATPPLVSQDPPTPAPDAGGGPPRRSVTRLQKILIGLGLAAVIITGATATALNSPARYSDAEACAEAMPLIQPVLDRGTDLTGPVLDELIVNVDRFEAARRRAVPDGDMAQVLAEVVTLMHDYQRTKDAGTLAVISFDLLYVTVNCQRRK
jgi:hypothetical protein